MGLRTRPSVSTAPGCPEGLGLWPADRPLWSDGTIRAGVHVVALRVPDMTTAPP